MYHALLPLSLHYQSHLDWFSCALWPRLSKSERWEAQTRGREGGCPSLCSLFDHLHPKCGASKPCRGEQIVFNCVPSHPGTGQINPWPPRAAGGRGVEITRPKSESFSPCVFKAEGKGEIHLEDQLSKEMCKSTLKLFPVRIGRCGRDRSVSISQPQ